jgi:hypothetical protein
VARSLSRYPSQPFCLSCCVSAGVELLQSTCSRSPRRSQRSCFSSFLPSTLSAGSLAASLLGTVHAYSHRELTPRSRQVEAIEAHHPGPGRHEVLDDLRLRIRAPVDLGQGPELGARTEDEIDTRVSNASLQRLILRKIGEAEAVQMKGRGSLFWSRT